MECKGKICDYYREYYNVIHVHGGYTPNFAVPTNKMCTHPRVFTRKGNVYDNGISVGILKMCPILNKISE